MSRPFRSVSRFVPRLDALNDRIAPSVSVSRPVVGVVTIRGDGNDNSVRITDNGTSAVGNVVVEVDGQRTEFDQPVSEIRLTGGGGEDSVRFNLTGDLTSDRTIVANLGNGNDTLIGEVRGDVADGVDFVVRANGGNGQDTIRVVGESVDTRAGASISVGLNGGNGRDDVSLDFTGVLTGRAAFVVSGGNGSDRLGGSVVLDPTSDGTLDGRWLGGNGADTGEVSLEGTERVIIGDTGVDGGRGQDEITTRGDLEPSPSR